MLFWGSSVGIACWRINSNRLKIYCYRHYVWSMLWSCLETTKTLLFYQFDPYIHPTWRKLSMILTIHLKATLDAFLVSEIHYTRSSMKVNCHLLHFTGSTFWDPKHLAVLTSVWVSIRLSLDLFYFWLHITQTCFYHTFR